MEIKHRPTMLMILDGFGLNPDSYGNAIAQAHKPNLDDIFARYPNTQLNASGTSVGLPDGQMGNSEVGHLNIGSGRIVYQDLSLISNAISDGSFFDNISLIKAMDNALHKGTALHILGLLSDGGVHSHIDHLKALLKMAKERKLEKVYLHCFLDGRDVPPRSSKEYIDDIESYMTELGIGKIVLIAGRYYAMDRDKRWDRVKLAYDAMTLRKGRNAPSSSEAIETAYENGESDEFVLPTCVGRNSADAENPAVKDGDSLIMFNFRPDRAREITRAFVDPQFDGFERAALLNDITYVCMTEYDATMPNVSVAFPPEEIKNTFGKYISDLGLTQLRIAETEKYAHVTFFFNGGVEEPNKNEDRILIPSPKVSTYDLQPEMSAYQVTDQVIQAVESDKYDCIILNFANADMVGHTGVMDAAVKAIETLDTCIPRIVEAVLKKGGQILLTADHGNADVMLDDNGNVITSHSLNPVPLIYIAEYPVKLLDGGKLADIAPTMLNLMGIKIPPEMTGRSLAID